MVRREGAEQNRQSAVSQYESQGSPSPLWSSDFAQLPTPSEQQESYFGNEAPMSGAQHPSIPPGKTSSDSGQNNALDRWSQRRLQRLNTEQGFREQRQGGQGGVLSPPPPSDQAAYNPGPASYFSSDAQAQPPPLHQQPQPHPPLQQPAYQSARTVQAGHPSAGLAGQTQPASGNSSRSPNYPQQDTLPGQPQQYSPPESASQYQSQDTSRPQVTQSRSFSLGGADDPSMSSSNNGNLPAPKPMRASAGNRQSVHNGLTSRDGSAVAGSQQQGVPAFNASVVPSAGQSQQYKSGQGQQQDVGRVTPQPMQLGEEMSEDDVNQLIKDHKELRMSSQILMCSCKYADLIDRREVHKGEEVLL